MTPKEKAKELIKKIEDADLVGSTDCGGCAFLDIKKCALIAVDEIINCDYFFDVYKDAQKFTSYWYEVKQEIEKL